MIRKRHMILKACVSARIHIASWPWPHVLFDECYTVHIEVSLTIHHFLVLYCQERDEYVPNYALNKGMSAVWHNNICEEVTLCV